MDLWESWSTGNWILDMSIAIVWYYSKASETMPNWRDGLRAAIEELRKVHKITWFLDEKIPSPFEEFDFILFWGDSNCPFFDQLGNYECRKGICLSTDPYNIDNLSKVDAIFCESEPVYEAVRMQGLRAIKAFGTDTDFYTPTEIEKDIEYFYPATFSPWKKQSQIAYLGDKLWCVGTVQPDGMEELKVCHDNNVHVEIGYFPPEKIRDYYNRAKHVIIPAIHGSERTVLEAMSMNILPEVVNNNINRKTASYIKEYLESGLSSPREFVLKNYSVQIYAKQLLKGIYE